MNTKQRFLITRTKDAMGIPSVTATAVLFALFQRFHNHEQAQSHYRDYGNRFIPNHLTHSFLKSFFVFAVHVCQCRYDYCKQAHAYPPEPYAPVSNH